METPPIPKVSNDLHQQPVSLPTHLLTTMCLPADKLCIRKFPLCKPGGAALSAEQTAAQATHLASMRRAFIAIVVLRNLVSQALNELLARLVEQGRWLQLLDATPPTLYQWALSRFGGPGTGVITEEVDADNNFLRFTAQDGTDTAAYHAARGNQDLRQARHRYIYQHSQAAERNDAIEQVVAGFE